MLVSPGRITAFIALAALASLSSASPLPQPQLGGLPDPTHDAQCTGIEVSVKSISTEVDTIINTVVPLLNIDVASTWAIPGPLLACKGLFTQLVTSINTVTTSLTVLQTPLTKDASAGIDTTLSTISTQITTVQSYFETLYPIYVKLGVTKLVSSMTGDMQVSLTKFEQALSVKIDPKYGTTSIQYVQSIEKVASDIKVYLDTGKPPPPVPTK